MTADEDSDILTLHIKRIDGRWVVSACVQNSTPMASASGSHPKIISDLLEECLSKLIENNPNLSHHGS